MLDIKFIRENLELVKEAARKKQAQIDFAELLRVDDERLALLGEIEEMRARQNKASEEISQGKNWLIEDMKMLKRELEEKEEKYRQVLFRWRALMFLVPNIPDISVPEGKTDIDNEELRKWGEIPKFSFTPKNQIELLQILNLADFERGTKVSGFRGYFLKNEAVLLSLALWRFSLDRLIALGFIPLLAPSLLRKEPFFGTGFLPQSEEDLYRTQDGEYLAGTGEVPAMGHFMDEIIPKEKLPIKFVVFSPCFRREAGSHGKDTKGLIRVHEFFKVEQVIFCEASHEKSVKHHEELLSISESLMQELKIPYRVVLNCAGDLGLGQVKKYDIEAWVPSEKKYRETHSASYFHDFQTRRLNIRYRDEEGSLRFVHSLNNTALATPRILVPILENNQEANGSIKVPDVLVSYLGFDRISPVRS